ncbi:MAG: STAS domain-containing protein [Rhodospirillales bacterium]|nr:STAS domain-containing protein [Rhodospirillales bacterium]
MKHEVWTEKDSVIISFSGDIDLEFSGDVRTILMESAPKGRSIIVDLSGVDVIDSSGIASLLEAFQNAHKKGKVFTIAAAQPSVMRVFKLARLETVFSIVDSVDEAINPES